MKKIIRIKREEAVLVAVDYQEKLLPAMENAPLIEKNTIKLAKGLKVMGVPGVITTQYSRGLGNTVAPVAEALGNLEPVDKTYFSAYMDEVFRQKLEDFGKTTVILAGIETHICVEQTALDLLAADCCGSRDLTNHRISIERLRKEGVVISSSESILYEILHGAKAPEFKEISAIVK